MPCTLPMHAGSSGVIQTLARVMQRVARARAIVAISLICFPFFAIAQSVPTGRATVTVFAAASLKTALDEIAQHFEASTGAKVAISYGGSPALARQIEQGAPADLFIAADRDWMDYVEARGLLIAKSRADLLGNSIVLIAPLDGPDKVALEAGELAKSLGKSRLSMALTASVPAGKYGRAALEKLGLWGEVATSIAESENVRAALAFVARGEAPLGIVYRTDATAEPKVKIVAEFPPSSHPPIIFPIATLAAATGPATDAFRTYLSGPASGRVFTAQGFRPVQLSTTQ